MASKNSPTDIEQPLVAAYWRVRASIGAYIGRMTKGTEETSDILQDAFLKLWGKGANSMSADEATALTARTAKNLAIDSWRRESRHGLSSIDENRDEMTDDDTEAEEEKRQRYESVRRIIATRLTPQQQQVMTLRDIDGMPYAEIAQQMGIEESAVRMCLSRARKAVRSIYEQECQ